MSAASVLARGRAKAESLMVDTCTALRKTGETTHPTTGVVVPTMSVIKAGQNCKVQSRGYWGEARDVGQAELIILALEVQFPIAFTGLDVGDEIVMTAVEHEPDLVGRVFRLKDLSHKSYATARRVLCREVTG